MEIGNFNVLRVNRSTDFGLYLADDNGDEVLLPKRYLKGAEHTGDTMEVFVYRDSEDRPVATTERPNAIVGDFALMRVKAVNAVGAFLDWGLVAKDLLVPFREQRVKMAVGRSYVVHVYLDHATGRVVASAKLEKFLSKQPPRYYHRQKVDALVVQRTELGHKVIVNGSHWGMIYQNETFRELNVGEHHTAFIKQVRPDGKIDLTVEKIEKLRVEDLARDILEHMRAHGGTMTLSDKSSPDEIAHAFACSKKDFKKALGLLYRNHKITLDPHPTLVR